MYNHYRNEKYNDHFPSDRLSFKMDSNIGPTDQSASEPSDCFDHVPADGASEVQVAMPPPQVESYNLIEPPPLDWRSDSSSEAGSADDLDDPSFPLAVVNGDKASPGEPVLLPLNTSDTLASPVVRQQEAVGNITEPVQDIKSESEEEGGAAEEEEEEKGVRSEVLKSVGEDQVKVTICDVKSSVAKEEVEGTNKRPGDEDHSSIHSLLSHLQLVGEEPHPTQLRPPHLGQHQYRSLSELEACTRSLITDNSTETTGLLFSESHHRDLLGLLQFTDIIATPHPTCLPVRGEVDAVVSVSYSQEDAQRFWGHCGNDQQQQKHRDESLTSLPDDECPDPVWKERGEELLVEEESVAGREQVG